MPKVIILMTTWSLRSAITCLQNYNNTEIQYLFGPINYVEIIAAFYRKVKQRLPLNTQQFITICRTCKKGKLILNLTVKSNLEMKQNMGKEIDSACSNPESTLS